MLKIIIIPESMKRGESILDSICRKETEPILFKTRRKVQTAGGTTYTVIPHEVRYLKGHKADQVILDYAFVDSLKFEVNEILRDSCVPEKFKIIDDRNILN